MSADRPAEASTVHTRLLKCALAVDEARAYWRRRPIADPRARAGAAFEELWFGPKSHTRVKVLLANLQVRFDAFPEAARALRRWHPMPPDTRRLVCHWHLQLADPLYRRFTGDLLPSRRAQGRLDLHRDALIPWVDAQDPGRWTMTTRIQFASKLLSAAHQAGLLGGTAGSGAPRPVLTPRVPDEALTYLLYLLRGVDFAGTLRDNPYLASVGLDGALLDARLRALPGVTYRRLGDHADFAWAHPDLPTWAAATQPSTEAPR